MSISTTDGLNGNRKCLNFQGRIQCTTAESAIDADDLVYIRHIIEGQDLLHLNYGTSAKSLTLSFYVYGRQQHGELTVGTFIN